jgi:chaperonin GroES
VLIQRAEAASKSKGGIIIPEKAQQKMREGLVVAAGPGARNEQTGATIPLSVKVGDTVLLPEFGGAKIELEDKEYTLLREGDLVAKLAKE